MNTETTVSGTKIYISRIFELVDEYIEKRLDGDEEKVNGKFRDLIFYIADRLQKIPNENIKELDDMFSVYVRLCAKYGKLPTIGLFAILAKINPATLTDWKNGEYRSTTHSKMVKKWLNICKSFVIDELSNSKIANPNLIFTAKAAYFLRETTPIPPQNSNQIPCRTREEIMASYGDIGIEADREFPEPPE